MRLITQALALLTLLLLSGSASGQWQLVHTFPHEISFVSFPYPNLGFVGLGLGPGGKIGTVGIYRTTDVGVTWTESKIPQNYSGSVTQILMDGPLIGWATVVPWSCTPNKGLWKTTDGGLSWQETTIVGACTSIYKTSKAQILTDIFGQLHISTDNGATFTSGYASNTNGIDFVDDLHGVIFGYRGQSWLRTTDGGVTWLDLPRLMEGWSVYGVKGTSTFYAAPEGWTDGTAFTPQILRSTDYGETWNIISEPPIYTTGHIAGIEESALYIQNHRPGDPSLDGIFRSLDAGKTWQGIGGPNTWADSRFEVSGDPCEGVIIWAFDFPGNLFKYHDNDVKSKGYALTAYKELTGKQNTKLAIPFEVRISSMLKLDTMELIELDFKGIFDPAVINIYPSQLLSRIIPPTGWSVQKAQIESGVVSVNMISSSIRPTSNTLGLGSIEFDVIGNAGSSSIVDFGGVSFSTPFAHYAFCSSLEGNFFARVDVVAAGVRDLASSRGEWIDVKDGLVSVRSVRETDRLQSITIYDLLGRSVIGRSVTGSSPVVDISALPAGVYTAVARFEHHEIHEKILK